MISAPRLAVSAAFAAVAIFTATACGDNVRDPDPQSEAPETYEFESRFVPGVSAVDFSGQLFRQLLIDGYKAELGGWTAEIDNDGKIQTAEAWLEELNFFFRFDPATSLAQPLPDLGLELPPQQSTWADISSGTNLLAKIAGEDDATDYRDWDGDGEPLGSEDGGLVGWQEGPAETPVELMDYWMGIVAQQAADRPSQVLVDPFGNDIEAVYITSAGVDLRQLSQKFLTGAVTYAQGTDDYLDSGTANKGIESSNLQDEDPAHTVLGHAWDEAFGYFGAARDYGTRSADDRTIAALDTDGDGAIDLSREYSTGMAKNAAKRDLTSQPGTRTTFAADIFSAFSRGRFVAWSDAGTELSEDAVRQLERERDIVRERWGDVFAATVIHYVNAVIAEMAKIGDAESNYSFTEHAKLWSELKGFALAFQFDPASKLSANDFETIHQLLGDAPVVTENDELLDDYKQALLNVRDIVRDAHSFDAANAASW